ncbi:MAG: hypothetical protein IKQ03_00890 [Prevotella sp.]|nr:hypothetical protein [Prevotella sp.]
MKKKLIFMLFLLCTIAQGVLAQALVKSEQELKDAITDDANIQLDADIQLSNYLNIEGVTVTINLNGHKLSRNLSDYDRAGHVIWAHGGSNLTLTSGVSGGSIEGGMAYNGGAIHIPYGNTVSAENVIFRNNSALEHAGAIWNNGTFTATDCTFTGNTASDVGGIYNSVTTDGAGTATLTGCTFTENQGTTGAGALANAMGNTEMTISGCTITGNTAGSNGGGIWNGGTLKMQGTVTVTDNHRNDGVVSNVYLKDEKVITLTGALTENSSIGVELENATGTFTSGYKDIHYQKDPNTFFTADLSAALSVVFDSNREAYLTIINNNDEYYVERSWDSTHEKVASTYKFLKGIIGYDVIPEEEGVYKLVTDAPESSPNEWFGMGGYSDNVAEFYVVEGNVQRETIVVQGKDVHLVLADNATLTLTGGLKLEGDNKLYIHCQSYGDKMGRLMVTNKYENAAGIGSAVHDGNENTVGELVIHGGHIESTGGQYAAGIGSCKRTKDEDLDLCKSITVYGGYVKATGGKEGAGIGVGRYNKYFHSAGGDFYLYDGTVLALGGESASGVGGGGRCPGINVMVYGGSLTALGGEDGAGIGSGSDYHGGRYGTQCGGTCTISGGTVTAIGGIKAAGIGGGKLCGGAEVNISGGRVMASGGRDGAGIGGGLYGFGGVVTISGGTVSATGGEGASGIGGGYEGKGGNVNITGGTVIAQTTDGAYGPGSAIGEGADSYKGMGELYIGDAMMVGAGNDGAVERIYDADERVDGCWYCYYAEISPCTHTGATYTVNGTDVNGTHTMHCSHCITEFEPKPHDFGGTDECSVCHFKGTTYTVTIYLPDANDDDTYETDGRYKTYTYNIVAGTSFTLPGAPQDLQDMEFAGWLVTTTTDAVPTFLTYKATADENLQPEKADYTLTGNVNFIARYKDIDISLADDSDNAETLYTYNGKKNASVTLEGRTLAKNGTWNTLCLPFSLDSFAGTPLEGATVKTLASATFEDGTLTLTFEDASEIVAGKPYIVKWAGQTSGNVENPVFEGVTINNTPNPVETDAVTFQGIYAPYYIGGANKKILYLDNGNKLCTPTTEMTINAQRAIFQLTSSGDLFGDVNGDGEINVADVTMTVDYILGKEPAGFIIDNADVNGDESIDITDVTVLVAIILDSNNIVLKNVVVTGADGITIDN